MFCYSYISLALFQPLIMISLKVTLTDVLLVIMSFLLEKILASTIFFL